MDVQVRPILTSSEQISSARLNRQVNPLSSNTSSSSAENIRSSSAVDGAWVEVAKGDDEASEEVRKMRSNSCSKPLFSNLNNNHKLARLTLNGFQHPLPLPTPLALLIWGTSLLR